jgi:hypothetical protein
MVRVTPPPFAHGSGARLVQLKKRTAGCDSVAGCGEALLWPDEVGEVDELDSPDR